MYVISNSVGAWIGLCVCVCICWHVHLCPRYLCDQVVPGNRVTILGIYSIKKMAAIKTKGKDKGAGVGIRSSYLRVVGIQVDTEGAGRFPTSGLWPLGPAVLISDGGLVLLFPLIQAVAPLGRSPPRRRRSWGRWLPPPTSTPRWPAPSPPPSTAATTWRGPSPVCYSEAPGKGASGSRAERVQRKSILPRMAVIFNYGDTFYL